MKILAVLLLMMIQFSLAGNCFSNYYSETDRPGAGVGDPKLILEKGKLSSGIVPKEIELNPTTKKYFTEGVVYIDSLPERLLMEGAYNWLTGVKYVNTLASKGIIMDEAVFNRILVNQYFVPSPELDAKKVRFRLVLEFRDGRFKYCFTDFSFYMTGSKIDFEEVNYIKFPEMGKLLRNLLKEANHYVDTSVNELVVYLKEYRVDKSW